MAASEYTIGTPTVSFEGGGTSAPPAPCAVNGAQITCNVGSVPLGGAKAVINYSVTSNEGGTFNDTTTVSTASTDDNAGNNAASAAVTVIPEANLGITKTAMPSPVLAGGLLTYTLTSTNAGPSSATDVSISDTLPSVTLFKSATPSAGGNCSVPAVDATGTVSCSWSGPTPRNAARSVQIVVEVPGPQTITNAATTTSPTEDPDLTNNATAVATQIICTIYGTEGSDALQGTDGFDVICGLGGNDSIRAAGGNDRVFGGSGNDSIRGDAGDDVLHGEDGTDHLLGGDGDDVLHGEAGNDHIFGGDGDDVLHGEAGNDHLLGEDGNDIMYGEVGTDDLLGGNGDDVLRGGDGNDHLLGGKGNDQLFGEADDDMLLGGLGADYLDGGAGTHDACVDQPPFLAPVGIVQCEFGPS